jgi:hypothetical protein
VVFGTVVALGGYGVFTALDLLFQSALLASLLGNTAFFVLMLLIPISIAVAVLRYRLYDIDLLINHTLHTLVYGALTATLVAVYIGSIVVLQGFIDRRFYRRKYDAAKTLEAFSAKLRNETDLDALSEDL